MLPETSEQYFITNQIFKCIRCSIEIKIENSTEYIRDYKNLRSVWGHLDVPIHCCLVPSAL